MIRSHPESPVVRGDAGAAEYLNVSVAFVTKERRNGHLPGFRIGKKVYLYRIVDLDAYVNNKIRNLDTGSISSKVYKSDGWVYFVGSDRLVKIGITSMSLAYRFKLLAYQCPVPLALIFAVECAQTRLLERRAHVRYAKYRRHGEWFLRKPVMRTAKTFLLTQAQDIDGHPKTLWSPASNGNAVEVCIERYDPDPDNYPSLVGLSNGR